MTKTIAEKLGVKQGSRTIFLDGPLDIESEIQLPALDMKQRLSGEFDYIHLFTKNEKAFHKQFPKAKKYLKKTGMLWLSWPKSGKLETDLTITRIIKIGYDYGLVESKVVGLNDIWSAIKFTHPKVGKQYNNSYGKLA